MRREQGKWNGMQLEVCSLNTAVVGTGAAGFNAVELKKVRNI